MHLKHCNNFLPFWDIVAESLLTLEHIEIEDLWFFQHLLIEWKHLPYMHFYT